MLWLYDSPLLTSTCVYVLPRPLSSSRVDGETMLCGRSGRVASGLVLTGLDPAYDKYFVGGEMGIFCWATAGMKKTTKTVGIAWGEKLQCVQNHCVCVCCVRCRTFDSLRTTGLVLPRPFGADWGSRMFEGTNPIWSKRFRHFHHFFDELMSWRENRSSEVITWRNTSAFKAPNCSCGCVPLGFLLVAQIVHCCF